MDAQLESIKARFDDFFDAYHKDDISDIITSFPDKRSLLVDAKVLGRHDPELANELIERPDNVIEAANESLKQKLQDSGHEGAELHVRFFGQNVNTPMVQDVGSKFIGKLILLDGLIVKRSEINPKVYVGFYRCTYCSATYRLRIDKEEVPELCPQCKRKSMKQDSGESQFTNLQKISLQDPLEKLKGSAPTWQLEARIEDDLVNTVLPGDRIDVTGILRIR